MVVVFCDMDLKDDELETRIGYLDVKTSNGVYFSVQRTTSFSATNEAMIPYQLERLNIGRAMNLATGAT